MPNNSPSPPSPSIELPPFALQIDVILLGLFALYVALTLPRSLFRLFRHSELSNGFFLRSGTAGHHQTRCVNSYSSAATTKKKPIRLPIALTSLAAVDIMPVDETEENTVESKRRKSYKSQRRAFTIPPRATAAADTKSFWSLRVPIRVLRWMRILHPTLAYALNFRVAPGISFGNLLVFLIYATLMLYASLYRPNPLTNPQLIGYLAISQIPIALVLAGKTNWIGLACGVGYEKLISMPLVMVVFDWDYAIQTAFPQKLVGVYSLFVTIHTACVVTILYATYRHRSACVPFVLAAVVLYTVDHLVRIVRTRHTTGWLTAEHALNRGTTLVLVPSLRAGWRAGQHVRVRIASDGWLVWLATWFLGRARPFTIAAGPDSGGMTLQIKALGSWSRNLLRMAEDADDIRLKGMSTSAERGRGSAREVRVIVEGPYGGPGYTLYTAYSGAVLVAGGSGISYVMGVLEDMLRNHASGKSHLRFIEVIWSISDPDPLELTGNHESDSLYSLLPELTPLMRPRASYHSSLSLRSFYWTGWNDDPRADLPRGIVVGVGRVSWTDWKDVGGVENVEESFGW
ncbi:hypothetical protein BGY98DRAFT_935474 [Russula aff. rugulosa BPL654]|nr:hypothetical protein BGY98DRAFT_935474 [Russula aff. rugulosa BPL654]